MEVKMQELFFVVAVIAIAMFWMRLVEALGWALTPILLFVEEKIEKLKKEFSPPEVGEKGHPQQDGDLCPNCEKGHLQIEYSPFHPQMATETYVPLELWPFDLVCSFCGESIPGKY